jgi:hypothetical protein
MTFQIQNRIKETAPAPGTSAFALAGAVTGFRSFSSKCSNGDTIFYSAWDGAGNWEIGLGTYNTSGNMLSRTTVLDSSTGSAINFSGAVSVWGDSPASQISQPANANKLINGGMILDQINSGVSVTITTANQYGPDCWQGVAAVSGKFSLQQNAGAQTPPQGSSYYLGATSLGAYTVGSSEYFLLRQTVEGANVQDLNWGTSSASPLALSFLVYSVAATGTFGGSIQNGAFNRSYPFTYSIPVAGVWTRINILIPGDTSGTWATGYTAGLVLNLSLGAGASESGPAGSWAGSGYASATGAVSILGTNGAALYFTQVKAEKSLVPTPYVEDSYSVLYQKCVRQCYVWEAIDSYSIVGFANVISGVGTTVVPFPTAMRVSPNLSVSGTFGLTDETGSSNQAATSGPSNDNNLLGSGANVNSMRLQTVCSGIGGTFLGYLTAYNSGGAKLIFSAQF